jgi:hypothetical protein
MPSVMYVDFPIIPWWLAAHSYGGFGVLLTGEKLPTYCAHSTRLVLYVSQICCMVEVRQHPGFHYPVLITFKCMRPNDLTSAHAKPTGIFKS